MNTIAQILLVISAIALIIAALFGLNIIQTALLGVSGMGFTALSTACSLLAIAINLVKPFGGSGSAS